MKHQPETGLIFLKLGGSLITDKTRPQTPRVDVLERLSDEIASALAARPGLRLVLGHGSGSFGHVPASRFGTRQGVHTTEEWHGFVEVWRVANDLNRLVLAALQSAGLPALTFSPAASVLTRDGQIIEWNLAPLARALDAGLVPIVYGDAVFDTERGGTILSTENLFSYLARQFPPVRLLLAGIEEGVWADFPNRTQLVTEIDPDSISQIASSLGLSAATDVTGGMASKVQEMLSLAQACHSEAFVFSGMVPGQVRRALLGERVGTRIAAGQSPYIDRPHNLD